MSGRRRLAGGCPLDGMVRFRLRRSGTAAPVIWNLMHGCQCVAGDPRSATSRLMSIASHVDRNGSRGRNPRFGGLRQTKQGQPSGESRVLTFFRERQLFRGPPQDGPPSRAMLLAPSLVTNQWFAGRRRTDGQARREGCVSCISERWLSTPSLGLSPGTQPGAKSATTLEHAFPSEPNVRIQRLPQAVRWNEGLGVTLLAP